MYQAFIKFIIFSCLFLANSSWSFEENFLHKTLYEEGKHYQRLNVNVVQNKHIQDLIAETPKKIQVLEFFNYGCFWCGRMRATIEKWVQHKPSNVVYYRFPLVFNKKWEVLAKAYYVTEALGKTETLDPEFFNTIHQEKKDLSDEKLLIEFFVKHGISEKNFLDLYQSFTINKELNKANNLAHAYQIVFSPVIIVNTASGSYLLTAKMAGGEQELLSVLDYLISSDTKKLEG